MLFSLFRDLGRLLSFMVLYIPAKAATATPETVNIYFAGGQANASIDWSQAAAREIEAADPRAYVVWINHGGEPLSTWHSISEGRSNYYLSDFYDPDSSNEGLLEAAFNRAIANGKTPVLKGLLWFQGETDQYIPGSYTGNGYYDKFLAFKNQIAIDFGAEALPASIAIVHEDNNTNVQLESIRRQQALLGELPDISAYDTKGLSRSDGVHLDLINQKAVGKAMADAMIGMVEAQQTLKLEISTSNDEIALSWNSRLGSVYQLEETTDLTNWSPLLDGETEGNGSKMTFSKATSSRGFFRLKQSPSLPKILRVAFMGDSQTAQNAVGDSILSAEGYGTQARALLGSRFDFVPNGSQLTFATGGFTTEQIIGTHLPQVMASNADICVFMTGSNDGPLTASDYAAKITWICNQLRTVGIVPICLDAPPSPLSRSGNSTGEISSSIASRWAITEAAVTAGGGYYIPCPATMETTSRSAYGVDAYFRADKIHLNDDGAFQYGKALAAFLKNHFAFSLNPYDMGGTDITSNPQLAGSNGHPTGWSEINYSTNSTGSEKLIPLEDGTFAWEITHTDGGTGGTSHMYYTAPQVGGSAQGKTTDTILTLQILSGSLTRAQLLTSVQGPEAFIGRDLNDPGNVPAATRYTAADGLIIIRTPKAVVNPPQTYVAPKFSFRGTATFRITAVRSRSFD